MALVNRSLHALKTSLCSNLCQSLDLSVESHMLAQSPHLKAVYALKTDNLSFAYHTCMRQGTGS
jgi:hypothetical protein